MRARNADLERDIAKMSIAVGNENIRNEMKLGDMQIKIKLVSCSSGKVSHNYLFCVISAVTRSADLAQQRLGFGGR